MASEMTTTKPEVRFHLADDGYQMPAAIKQLTQYDNWTVWKWIRRGDKWEKLPVDAKTGEAASSTDPETWSSYDRALARYRQGGYDGMQFMPTPDDIEAVFGDLDECVIDDDDIEGWAQDIIGQLETYTEYSPGDGLRFIGLGTLPPHGRKKGDIEMYVKAKPMTITGAHLAATPETIEDCSEIIREIHYEVFGEAKTVSTSEKSEEPEHLPDEEVLRLARRFNNPKFDELWSAKWEKLNQYKDDGGQLLYPSESEATQGLCGILDYYANNADQVERIFRKSELMRDKCDEPRGDGTWLSWSISNIENETHWDPNHKPSDNGTEPKGDDSSPAGLPGIQTNARYHRDISDDSYRALLARNNPPFIFVRGARLARIGYDENKRPIAQTINVDELKHHLDRSANFFTRNVLQSGEVKDTKRGIPKVIVQDVLAYPHWPEVPPLDGIVSAPTFSKDGKLNTRPGYHRGSRLYYYDTGLRIGDTRPTAENLQRAIQLIFTELLGDFPFVDQASRVNAASILVTPFVRPMIDGNTPVYITSAPEVGTGKTSLNEVVLSVSSGESLNLMSAPKDEDEWRKRITAALAQAPSHILFDNVKGLIESGTLAAVLTTGNYTDRILGKSEMVTYPIKNVWAITGNNVEVSDEIARRSTWVVLDAVEEKPWERTSFRHKNIHRWTLENRGELVTSVYVLVNNWIEQGRQPGSCSVNSFESWSTTLSGIFEACGIDGLMANAAKMFERATSDRQPWAAFVEEWAKVHGTKVVTTDMLFPLASQYDERAGVKGEGENILSEVITSKTERGRQTQFGQALKKRDGRVYSGYQIKLLEYSSGKPKYRLVKADEIRPAPSEIPTELVGGML